jgi:hypothetical protein
MKITVLGYKCNFWLFTINLVIFVCICCLLFEIWGKLMWQISELYIVLVFAFNFVYCVLKQTVMNMGYI